MRDLDDGESSLEKAVCRSLDRLCADEPEGGILVGYSGGADSTALASALAGKTAQGRKIVLGHVDHALRSRSELDTERLILQDTASALALPLRVVSLGRGLVEEAAKRDSSGIEAAARAMRLEALESLRREEGLSWIALAHNAQDQAETRIARFFQGSGPRGLKGIPARRGRIVRPLLGVSRKEIVSYLSGRGLSWSEDSSNAEDRYLRNRIRGRLLPVLNGVFPGWRSSLETGGERSMMIADLMDSLCAGLLEEEDQGCFSIPAEKWDALHVALRLHLLEEASSRLFPGRRTPFGLLRQALRDGSGKGTIGAGAGMEIRRDCRKVIVRKRLVQPAKTGYFFSVDGPMEASLPDGRKIVLSEGNDPLGGPSLGVVEFPALLRTARPGDTLAGADGSRKLPDILREWGAGPLLRDSIPVLEDRHGIICVFGAAVGFRNRCAERAWAPARAETFFTLSIEGSTASNV